MAKETLSFLKISTEWIELEIISEVDVIPTTYGYTPFLQVREIKTDAEYRLYISAKSLANPLEELRKDNSGIFEGIQFRIRKESTDQKARYEVETGDGFEKKPKPSVDTNEGFQKRLKSSANIKKKLEEVLLN